MYPGYLNSFDTRFRGIKNLSYYEHLNLLLNDSTEFAGSYTRTFKKLGINAECIIANYTLLQNKWTTKNIANFKNGKHILFEQVKKYKPEILWIENLSYTDKEWLAKIRTEVKSIKLIIAYHCSPLSQKIIDRFSLVDFVITCTPGLRQDMENLGIRSYLVYHGFDSDLLNKTNEKPVLPQNNFIFSGSLSTGAGFHEERIELIENLLKAQIGLELYVNLDAKSKIWAKQSLFLLNKFLNKSGMQRISNAFPILKKGATPVRDYSDTLRGKMNNPVFGIEMYNLFKNSKVVLNFHIGIAGKYAGNMRLFEVTGVGSCLLTDNKSNLGDLFVVNKEIVVYDNLEDCIAKAKWLLTNEDEREKIAAAGQQRTLTLHTVENRCKLILEIIVDELNRN